MERPVHSITALTDKLPSNLLTLEDAADRFELSPHRLRELADGGFAPHYRIDGGAPRFSSVELKAWIGHNLVQRHEGRPFPVNPVSIVIDAPPVSDFRNVPKSIRQVADLRDITGEIRRTGIYFLCRESLVLYVGQSINVMGRMQEHVRTIEFDQVLFLPWPAGDLGRLEGALIRALRPPMNGMSTTGKMVAPGNPADDEAILNQIKNGGGDDGAISMQSAAACREAYSNGPAGNAVSE